MLSLLSLLFSAGLSSAWASVDPDCNRLAKPEDYDEQVQQDFLQNYNALALSLSPLHGPVPNKAGHASVGLDLVGIPPLGCGQRFVLDWTKTEDTNKAPIAPRPRVVVTLQPLFGRVFPYLGAAAIPPVKVAGTRNLVLSAEGGAGMYVGSHLSLGLRGHATLMRTIGDVATAFDEETEPVVNDLFLASTSGVDLLAGWDIKGFVPYAAVGITEASTFFWVGDDSIASRNLHPYRGLAFSLGADALVIKHLRLGGEFYGAPGGYSNPEGAETYNEASSVDEASRYGHIYTGRLRIAYEL